MREAIGANFEGATYPENTILVAIHFPFQDHLKDLSGVNYIWKKGGTYSLLRLPDLWRISLHPAAGQTPEEALTDKSIQAQTRVVLPNDENNDENLDMMQKMHLRSPSTRCHTLS